MGQLIDELGNHLSGGTGWDLSDDPAQLADALADLYGSGRAAARALGVAESTFRAWRRGSRPKGDRRREMVSQLRRNMAPDRLAAAHGDGELAIRGRVTVSGDTRERVVHPGRFIPKPVMGRVLAAWERVDDARAEAMLVNAIDRYYQPLAFDRIDEVWFE
jgi:hypothetical protein